MDPKTIFEKAQDAMSARSVYAEPYTESGTTILRSPPCEVAEAAVVTGGLTAEAASA